MQKVLNNNTFQDQITVNTNNINNDHKNNNMLSTSFNSQTMSDMMSTTRSAVKKRNMVSQLNHFLLKNNDNTI